MQTPLTLSDLINLVQRKDRELPPPVVDKAVRRVFREIINALEGGRRVELRGFGSFEVREYESGTRRNPKTGAAVEVPAKRGVHWKTGKELANQLFDRFEAPGKANVSYADQDEAEAKNAIVTRPRADGHRNER